MKSKASIKGHSLHRILVAFPIAFFTATLVSDVVFFITDRTIFFETAGGLEAAGIISAFAAAVPGAIDYFYTVPPKSSASTRATKHAILNILMLLIFSAALYIRTQESIAPLILVALEGTGLLMMCFAGWLGGTLVGRNQIGIDHRYAAAGKWQEEAIQSADSKIELKTIDKLGLNQMKLLHINGQRVVIAKTESGFLAFEDRCSHRGASLADGVLICGTVQCPWHGSQFSCRDGSVVAGPAKEKIRTYKIEHSDAGYFLELK
ncbi:MAG: DUF2231 domain-containing protein [Bacteroidia bacterium]